MFGGYTYTVVTHRKLPMPVYLFCLDLNLRRSIFLIKFKGIANEVLKDLLHSVG